MLNFIKKLFGKSEPVETQAPFGKPAFNPEYVAQLEIPTKELEFHEEIRAQVEAEKAKTDKVQKPAVKAKSNKGKKAPAKIKAEAKPAPAKKKPATKKSK